MTLFSALNAGVTGIQSSGSEISIKADNIANVNTIAAKRFEAVRKSLVNPADGSYVAGGVELGKAATLDVQGTIESSSVASHMAIEGNGMFIVSGQDTESFTPKFTRQGDFTIDNKGNLVNSSGMFLKAYKLTGDPSVDENKLASSTIDYLTTVNVNDIGSTPTRTTAMQIAANLKANQGILEGSGSSISFPTNVSYNRNLEKDQIIYPELGIAVDDQLSITFGVNAQKVDFTYGGFSSGSQISNDAAILGSNTISQKFSTLSSGDTITIASSSTTKAAEFKFEKDSPDKTKYQFNSLESLAEAIDYHEHFSSRVTDGKLVVSSVDANDSLTFANGTSMIPTRSIDLSSNDIYGHGTAVSSLSSNDITVGAGIFGVNAIATTFTGLTDGDSFSVSTGEGTYRFSFKGTAPNALGKEFNNLTTLRNAINAGTGGALTAALSGGSLIISAPTGSSILEAVDDGNRSMVQPLGIKLQNSFSVSDGATIGDGMSMEIGSFTMKDSNTLPFSSTDILGEYKRIIGSETATVAKPILGATTAGTNFTTATTGDGVTINTSVGSVTFILGAAGNIGFTNMTDLATKITAHPTLTGVIAATSTGDRLTLTPAGTDFIKSISSFGTGKSDFAKELGIELYEPALNDAIEITLDSGKTETFKFTGKNNGSDAGGAPKASFGEFNSIDSLQQAIKGNLGDELTATTTATGLSIVSNGSNTIRSIIDSAGSLAEDFGIDLESIKFNLSFTGQTQGSASGGKPDYLQGEFNNLLSLSQAVNNMSKKQASFNFGGNGNSFSVDVTNGGKVKYINDSNDDGESDFATSLGIRGVDLTSSLGLANISSGARRFNSIENLKSLVEDETGISAKYSGGNLKIYSDDPMSSITFSSGNVDMMKFLNLPITKLDSKYNPLVNSSNMASSNVDSHFSRKVKVIDSLGSSHNVSIAYVKVAQNKWNFEIFADDMKEIKTSRNDPLLAHGSMSFNGKGKMTSNTFNAVFAPTTASNPPKFKVQWTNGAEDNEIAFDFEDDDPVGPINLTNGIRQVDGEYVVNKLDQNGLQVSSPSSIEISHDGIISANINGQIKDAYQIQLATFINANGLKLEGYNTYGQTKSAGTYSVQNPNKGITGKLVSSALEKSNVEIVSELSQMIISQRSYQANAKVIQVANQAMEELNKIMG